MVVVVYMETIHKKTVFTLVVKGIEGGYGKCHCSVWDEDGAGLWQRNQAHRGRRGSGGKKSLGIVGYLMPVRLTGVQRGSSAKFPNLELLRNAPHRSSIKAGRELTCQECRDGFLPG